LPGKRRKKGGVFRWLFVLAVVAVAVSYSSNNTLQGNRVEQQSVTAIDLASGANNDNTIQGNILDGNSYGIDIENSFGTIVKRNRIVSNYYGIVLYQAKKINIRRNTISNNYYGISASETSESTMGFNNFYKDYLYGLYAYASTVIARWNWWGAATGPQGKGDHLSVVNHGRITYTPWKLLPVLFAGVIPPMLATNAHQLKVMSPWLNVPFGSLLELTHGECNEHHASWDDKVTIEVHPPVTRNKVSVSMSLLLQLLPEVHNEKH
jgi:parallel beta-helix repeat protein